MANRSYRLVTTLLYPASLGAALVWFAQGIWFWEITLHRHASGPSNWALAFALWFLVAYTSWFARLTDPEVEGKYSRRSLASDLVDAATTFVAFGYLGLVMTDVHETPPAVFLCSSLVSISSIIAKTKRPAIVYIGVGVSAVGLFANWPHTLPHIVWINRCCLAILWALLIVYEKCNVYVHKDVEVTA